MEPWRRAIGQELSDEVTAVDWRAIQDSGYPYVQKPYSLSDLLEAMKVALEARP